jgi:hypothetical protein
VIIVISVLFMIRIFHPASNQAIMIGLEEVRREKNVDQ